jgi:ABC-2 type transport system ATP-binding protein
MVRTGPAWAYPGLGLAKVVPQGREPVWEHTVIEIQELHKYYGDRRAIGPLSIQIEEGEIVGLLGLNGAGKTTTLRVLACDLLPTSGTVKIGGFDVVAQPDEVRARVGYLPDRPPLYDDMSVDEYLSFAARLRRVPGSDVSRRVSDVVEQTELGAVRSQMVGTLSHGFRQRVGIAQAIVHRPKFVVLDEPISGLDPVQIVEMRELLRSLRGEHTVIVSSHILSEISETCDRLLVIEEGRISWEGTEKKLFSELGQGMQVEVTARGTTPERVTEIVRAVPGVQGVELVSASEPGEAIVTAQVTASTDVRDAVCRALVKADISVLELVRRQGLESMVLKLLGGDEAADRRRARKKREPEPGSAGVAKSAAAAKETT